MNNKTFMAKTKICQRLKHVNSKNLAFIHTHLITLTNRYLHIVQR
jgi:hypothetical protein